MDHQKFRRILLFVAGGIIALVIAVKVFASKASPSSTSSTDSSGGATGPGGITVLEFQQAAPTAPGTPTGTTPPPPTTPTSGGTHNPVDPLPKGPWHGQPIGGPRNPIDPAHRAAAVASAGRTAGNAVASRPRPTPRPGVVGSIAGGVHRTGNQAHAPTVSGLSAGKQRSLNRLGAA